METVSFKKNFDFLVGVDSDGCAFDSMDFKHKECFVPATINVWDLQPVAKFARETWEFVNLYSVTRGMNRFPALVRFFDLMEQRPEVLERGFVKPDLSSLVKWVEEEKLLGNPSLEKKAKESRDHILIKTLEWSIAVNDAVSNMARNLLPFPFVRECLAKISAKADILVVSAANSQALRREWREHDIEQYVKCIAGQEMGTKKVHLELAKRCGYTDNQMLMIGDAIGDLEAAAANNILFYPIMPGHEADSWKLLYEEAFDLFIQGRYQGLYQNKLHSEFKYLLPERPPWQVKE